MFAFLNHLHVVDIICLHHHLLIFFLAIVNVGVHAAEHDAAEFVAFASLAVTILAGERIIVILASCIQILLLSILAEVVRDTLADPLTLLLFLALTLAPLSIHAFLESLAEIELVGRGPLRSLFLSVYKSEGQKAAHRIAN